MADEAETNRKFTQKGGQFRLWLGLLLPVAAWAFQMQATLVLVHYECAAGGSKTALHIVSLAALLLVSTGGFISWKNWTAAGAELPTEQAGALERSRFLSIVGLLLGCLFFLLVVALWLPNLFMSPCEK